MWHMPIFPQIVIDRSSSQISGGVKPSGSDSHFEYLDPQLREQAEGLLQALSGAKLTRAYICSLMHPVAQRANAVHKTNMKPAFSI